MLKRRMCKLKNDRLANSGTVLNLAGRTTYIIAAQKCSDSELR